jgi:hypothetical protein
MMPIQPGTRHIRQYGMTAQQATRSKQQRNSTKARRDQQTESFAVKQA